MNAYTKFRAYENAIWKIDKGQTVRPKIWESGTFDSFAVIANDLVNSWQACQKDFSATQSRMPIIPTSVYSFPLIIEKFIYNWIRMEDLNFNPNSKNFQRRVADNVTR